MGKKHYTVASEEGAAYAGADIGETVTLELSQSDETALVCAGWLEPAKATGKKEEGK